MKAFIAKWHRLITQIIWTFLSNPYVANVSTGALFKGKTKFICVPGLNCYSCPAAGFACPIGSLQSCFGDLGTIVYVLGIILTFSLLLGRKICGFLCPFGLLQDLLHKIPTKKLNDRLIHPKATVTKYFILEIFVVSIPAITAMDFLPIPDFCKFICPQGILQGALPISTVNTQIRSSLGIYFWIKLTTTLTICIFSVIMLRPFCKFICPLGAIYGFFNKVAVYRMHLDTGRCVGCGACAKVCKMNVDPSAKPNSCECIRCGDCVNSCPHGALKLCVGRPSDQ